MYRGFWISAPDKYFYFFDCEPPLSPVNGVETREERTYTSTKAENANVNNTIT
jgi:hypothetical protein